MIRPTNISIIKDDDYFRLKYKVDGTIVKTQGFRNRKELAKIIEEDNFFKLEIGGDEK